MTKYTAKIVRLRDLSTHTSRAGNNLLVASFTDSKERLYYHYISINRKSQIWMNQLLMGYYEPRLITGVEMDLVCDNAYRDLIGKYYKIHVEEKLGSANRHPVHIAAHVYSLFDKQQEAEDQFTRGYKQTIWYSERSSTIFEEGEVEYEGRC